MAGAHTYAEEGSYALSISVVDDGGSTTTISGTATVADAAPTVWAAHASVSAAENWAATNTGTFADYDDAVTITASAGTVSQSSVSTNGTWSWSQSGLLAGNYTVTVTATNANASTASTSFTVTVSPTIVILNPTVSGALTLSGNASLNIGGTLYVDSGSSSAISASGNSHVTALVIDVHGGYQKSGNATFSVTPATMQPVLADPLAYLIAPTASGGTSVNVSGNSTQTINPGIYRSIKVSGNGSLTLTPGLYIITGGGLSVTGNGSLSGSGVMIYNGGSGGTYGGIALSGNGKFNLTAPTYRDLCGNSDLPGPR